MTVYRTIIELDNSRGSHKAGKVEFRVERVAREHVIVTLFSPYSDACCAIRVDIADTDSLNAEANITPDDLHLIRGKARKWNSDSETVLTIAYHAASVWSEKQISP